MFLEGGFTISTVVKIFLPEDWGAQVAENVMRKCWHDEEQFEKDDQGRVMTTLASTDAVAAHG